MWNCVLALAKKLPKESNTLDLQNYFLLQKILGTCSKHSSDEDHIFGDLSNFILVR